VTVIDKGELCSGCSFANAGLITPSHCVPLAAPGTFAKVIKWTLNPNSPFHLKVRMDPELFTWLWKFYRACNKKHLKKSMPVIRDLSLASLDLFEQFAHEQGLDIHFKQKGLLMVYKTSKGFKEGVHEAKLVQSIGIEAEILSPAELTAREPTVATDMSGGVYYPQDAHIDPLKFVRKLAQNIEVNGGHIQTSTNVTGFDLTGRNVTAVKTTRGDFSARQIVIASGAWSNALARRLNVKLPLQAAKGYSITVQRPKRCPALPLLLAEAKIAVTPLGELLRFGGTLELAGLDLSMNMRRINAILDKLPLYLPAVDSGDIERAELWCSLRPCTPDGLPYLGRPPQFDNLTIAAGHGMIGLSLGPITGKLVAQLVTNQKTSIDLQPLRIDRFN